MRDITWNNQASVQQKVLASAEMIIAIACFAVAIWPLSGLCSGRPLAQDCESWFIFGVNFFGPFGLLALVCSVWSIKTSSLAPHIVLGGGLLALTTFWFVLARL